MARGSMPFWDGRVCSGPLIARPSPGWRRAKRSAPDGAGEEGEDVGGDFVAVGLVEEFVARVGIDRHLSLIHILRCRRAI